MKAEIKRCDCCADTRVMISMSLDEARLLQDDLPRDPGDFLGDMETPMLELFVHRLNDVLHRAPQPQARTA